MLLPVGLVGNSLLHIALQRAVTQAHMTVDPLEVAEASEKLGIVGVLVLIILLVVPAGIWVIRFLYKEKEACAKDRLENTAAIGELKGDVRSLNVQLEAQEKAMEDHRTDMEKLHNSALAIVAGRDSRTN